MTDRRLLWASSCLGLLFLSGCNGFKEWYAKEFKMGDATVAIGQLSTQHLSVMTKEMVNRFKDPAVPVEIIPSEDPLGYGKGYVVRRLKNIEIDYPEKKQVLVDCIGTTATWKGKVTADGEQRIYGWLTNNPDNPVIPDPSDSIKMSFVIRPEHSTIKFSDKDAYLKFYRGTISYDAVVRLAQSQKPGAMNGLRLVPTSNMRYENVALKDVEGKLYSNRVNMTFDVSDSNYRIQVGEGEHGESNKLMGDITAFGQPRQIPLEGDTLNPDYDLLKFEESYSCHPDLQGKVSYDHVPLEQKLGPGMAALSTLVMSRVAAKFADDHLCGMSSPAFLKSMNLSGAPGDKGASNAKYNGDCAVNFAKFKTDPDCFGIAYEVSGQAVVKSAARELRGLVMFPKADFLTMIDYYERALARGDIALALSDRPEAVMPVYRQPATVDITADLSNVTIDEVCEKIGSIDHEHHCSKQENFSPLSFSLSGEATINVKPVMAKGIDPADVRTHGMCAVKKLPIAETAVTLNQVNASLRRNGMQFLMTAKGAYRAINGKIGAEENQLSGEVKIGQVMVPFKNQDAAYLPLKPDYDAKVFEDSYLSCNSGKFIVPASDAECAFP